MLVKRRLTLAPSALLAETLLRRDDIADIQRASEVLRDARLEAEQHLADTREQAQREKDAALAEFWAQANGFLQDLEQQRQTFQVESMEAVEALLNTALARLLDEATLSERIRALIRHLGDSQRYAAVATLSAHPDSLNELRQWLAGSRFAEHWQLKGDALMAPQALKLSDANGAFDIDWSSLRRGLLGDSSQ